MPIVSPVGHSEWAYALAKDLLETTLPRRWAHTQGVAEQAESLAPILGADADTLLAACLLHDIGYAPDLVDTGMHQLDGARYLRNVAGADERLCRLVAYHSCADNEARQRDLFDVLAKEFDQERPDLARALTYCDMTTDPDGRHLDVLDRLAEIHARYGPEHVVSRSITDATPCIVSSVRSVEAALSDVRQADTG
ncbi:HD domain-containing protein [Nonomuraea sp. KC401]|nr:HD domain-containing protein [Nonomuraea sp. K271]NBE99992.1 HD domain-containing protein [Nonomuraea sp. K271]TLF54489.1 HD domain-containing protein [Nonomuraea sp. KC401]